MIGSENEPDPPAGRWGPTTYMPSTRISIFGVKMGKHDPWPPEFFPLIRGPLDGASVRSRKPMPEVIFCGRACDGEYVMWAREGNSRYPFKYVVDCYRFIYWPTYPE